MADYHKRVINDRRLWVRIPVLGTFFNPRNFSCGRSVYLHFLAFYSTNVFEIGTRGLACLLSINWNLFISVLEPVSARQQKIHWELHKVYFDFRVGVADIFNECILEIVICYSDVIFKHWSRQAGCSDRPGQNLGFTVRAPDSETKLVLIWIWSSHCVLQKWCAYVIVMNSAYTQWKKETQLSV